jgi:hypothetical protein
MSEIKLEPIAKEQIKKLLGITTDPELEMFVEKVDLLAMEYQINLETLREVVTWISGGSIK